MRRALTALVAVVILAAPTAALASPDLFPNPPALQPQVRFWTRIYTEVGTDAALIHDANDLDVVYERVDFPESLGGRAVDALYESNKEKYRGILRRLAAGARDDLSAEERRVLALFPQGVSQETLQLAAENVRLQRGQANRFREGLVRSGAWEGHIAGVLSRKGLPKELITLPHVESSYNPEAYSKVGAAGLWQFMPGTGRTFRLRVTPVVDERMDPFRATEAAADLLGDNHSRLGTWPLALTAYNHGAGGLVRAVRDTGTSDISEIVRRYRGPGFGFASRNFYTSFLAAQEASSNAERYFGKIQKQAPTEYREVRLDKPFSVQALKNTFGVDLDTLQAHNLALREGFWKGRQKAPAGVTVRVPKGRQPADALAIARADGWRPAPPSEPPTAAERDEQVAAVEAAGAAVASDVPAADADAAVPAPPPVARTGTVIHVVQAGETAASLSRRYGVPASTILGVNHVASARSLKPGQRLRIPSMAQDPPAPVMVAAPVPAAPDPTSSTSPTAPIASRGEERPGPAEVARVEEPAPAATADTDATEIAEPTQASDAPQAVALAEPPARAPDVSELVRETLDRSRYRLGPNQTIVLQTDETLALVADWAGTTPEKVRGWNKLSRKAKPGPGHKLRLELSKAARKKFETRRLAYHEELRDQFFSAFEVAGTEKRVVRKGDTLWSLTRGKTPVPAWLLDYYNPNVDLRSLRPGKRVVIPKLEKRNS